MTYSDKRNVAYPKMIAFFGPDGAGKSTQAELLAKHLASQQCKVKRAWIRSVHTFAFILWSIFWKLGLCHKRSNIPLDGIRPAISYLRQTPYGAVSPISMNPPVLKGAFSRILWSIIDTISVLPILLIQVYTPLVLGYCVIAERYIIDSIASIAYFVNDPQFFKGRFAKLLLKFIPEQTVFVFVDADYDTISLRRRNVAGPAEYTEFHRKMYLELTPIVKAIYVNTSTLSVQETHKRILYSILAKMESDGKYKVAN